MLHYTFCWLLNLLRVTRASTSQAGEVRLVSVCSSAVADNRMLPLLSPKPHLFIAACKCSDVIVLIFIDCVCH